MDSLKHIQLDKYKENDSYGLWKYRLNVAFKQAQVYETAYQTECPDGTDEPKWTREQDIARTIISAGLDNEVLAKVYTLPTVKDMIDELDALAAELFAGILAFRDLQPETPLQWHDQSAMDNMLKQRKFAKHTVKVPQRVSYQLPGY